MKRHWQWYRATAFIFLAASFVRQAAFAEYRTWTGKNGVTMEAELVSINDNGSSVSIRLKNGEVRQTFLNNISTEDQQYIKSYEKDAKAKGLVKFKGQWLSQTQIKRIEMQERETAYIAQADKLIMSKAKKRVSFQVLQASGSDGFCIMGLGSSTLAPKSSGLSELDRLEWEVFLFLGNQDTAIADKEWFEGDLFWAGTYTYETRLQRDKTVNCYSFTKDVARSAVRKQFGLYESKTSDIDTPSLGISSSDPILADRGVKGFGSGFIITKDGYLLTNHHVINEAKQVKVKTEDFIVSANIVAQDRDNDIALLKIEGTYVPVAFTSEKTAKLGQTIFTVGFPLPDLQGFSPKVTKGVISSLNGIQDDVRRYQIDAAIQLGNSGGPLADENGDIIGIVVARLNDSYVAKNTGSLPQNVNYSVKKSYVMAFIDNEQQVSKQIQVATESENVPFEDAVDRVRRATVLVIVY